MFVFYYLRNQMGKKLYGQWLAGSIVMVYDFDNLDLKQLAAIRNRYHVTSFCAPPKSIDI